MPSLVLNLAGAIIHISTKSVLSICQTINFFAEKRGFQMGGLQGAQKGSRWGQDGSKGGSTFCTDPSNTIDWREYDTKAALSHS